MLGNGTINLRSDIPDVEASIPLRIRNHPEVRRLAEKCEEKRDELKELRRNRREANARRDELEEKFTESLNPGSDLDPSEVREKRLELEEELDRFQEHRTALRTEIAELERRIDEEAEAAREEISTEVGEPLRQLHAAYAHHLQQAVRAHLKLKEFDALERSQQRVGSRHVERPELPVDDPQFGFPGLVGAYKQLRSLKRDGFDIDPDLLERLRDEVHA